MKLKTFIPLCLVVSAYVAPPVLAQQQPSLGRADSAAPTPEPFQPVDAAFVPTVESKTQALQVLSVTRRDPYVLIKIKNVSDKKIYSFSMSYHRNGQALLFSFIMSDTRTALMPGEVYKYDYAFFPNSSLAREPLTFGAVLFEDGTGDGQPETVKTLQDLFLTNRKELEHVIALLQAASKSPRVETVDDLRGLLRKVSETPDYMYSAARSSMTGITLTLWKATAMHMIEDIAEKKLKDESVNIQNELTNVLEKFNKALAKYPSV